MGVLQPCRVLGFTQPGALARLVHPTCWVLTSSSSVLSPSEGRGAFPGAEIYHMVEQVNGHLKESILKALEEER